jgi:ribonuclease P protein component
MNAASMTSFRPAEHVRRRTDFEQIYAGGVKITGRFMTLFVRPTAEGRARLGVAATRKIGGAVTRNRAKRLTRELFRHNKPSTSVDVVVVPRREFLDASYSILEREFGVLLERAGRTGRTTTRSDVGQPRRRRRSGADSRL